MFADFSYAAAVALIIVFFLGLSVGALFALRYTKINRGLRARQGDMEKELAAMRVRDGDFNDLRRQVGELQDRNAALQAEAAAQLARLTERERAVVEQKTTLEREFKATTAQLLDDAHAAFIKRAKETFERYRESAQSDGEQRRKALDELMRPLSETLVRYEKNLGELRAEQQKSRGELSGRIGELAQSTQQVRLEAQKLATALRAGPKTRGRWGEEQLRNVVEIAGMSAYVDFVEQAAHGGPDGRKHPDMIVRLPGARVVAVDSKVSLNAYLEAIDAETDDERRRLMTRHADDLWAHVKALSAKDYAASVRDALDYVIMFVPGENYFSAAVDMRPQLYQDAFDRKILIATPTILIAMLKSAALNWRQEKLTEHAQAVAGMAKDLYDSLRRMGANITRLGGSIESTVKNFNAVVANVEGRVLPRARKFAEYELPGTESPIDELRPVETSRRLLRSEKDDRSQTDVDKRDDAA